MVSFEDYIATTSGQHLRGSHVTSGFNKTQELRFVADDYWSNDSSLSIALAQEGTNDDDDVLQNMELFFGLSGDGELRVHGSRVEATLSVPTGQHAFVRHEFESDDLVQIMEAFR